MAAMGRQLLATHCPPGAAAPRKPWITEATFALVMAHAHERRCFFDMCGLRTQARMLACLEGWRALAAHARRTPAAAPYTPPATERHDAWLQLEWSMSLARQRLRMIAASGTAGRAARADFALWAEEQARLVGHAAARGQFAPLWALAKRLSGRGTSKGPRALPVILLPDGSVAQSEA